MSFPYKYKSPLSREEFAKRRGALKNPVSQKDIRELLSKLIDTGPLWYRGVMPEEGKATRIISDWLKSSVGVGVEEEKT
jgi:hypothetical protein